MTTNDDTLARPVREAVLRYQRPAQKDDPATTSTDIVHGMCARAILDAPFKFVLSTDDDDLYFDIIADPDFGDGPDSQDSRGVFCVGDELPEMWDGSESGPYIEHIKTCMRTLHDLLAESLHYERNLKHWSVFAQVGSDDPRIPLSQIPAGGFHRYRVVDWCNGTMRHEAVTLYNVNIAHGACSIPEAAKIESLPAVSAVEISTRRRGPKGYDWRSAERLCRELLDTHGLPHLSNDALPTQAALEAMVAVHMSLKNKSGDKAPGEPTVRRYVSRWLQEFKEAQAPDKPKARN